MIRLFRYMKPYRMTALLCPLVVLVQVLCNMLLPYLMSFIVNYGIAGLDVYGADGNATAARLLELAFGRGSAYAGAQVIVLFGVIMLGLSLLSGISGVVAAFLSAYSAQHFGHDLRKDVFGRIMELSIEQADQFTTGSLITRMTNDVQQVVMFMGMLLRMFVRAPLFIVIGTVMLLMLDLNFGFVLLCTLPLLFFALWRILSKAVPMYSLVQMKLDRVNAVVQENLNGARVVKAYTMEEFERERFRGANEDLCAFNERVLRLMAVVPPLTTIVMNASIIAVIYIGGLDISRGVAGMTTGGIMAAVTYVTQVVQSIEMITDMLQSVSRAQASAERIHEVLDVHPAILSGTARPEAGEVAVRFDHVSFRYPGMSGEPVLKDIDLTIRRGEFLGIIGPTGCGKTTLLSLIPRFYDADEGTVYVDGTPVQEQDLRHLRGKLGFVMQRSEMFGESLEENIRWGRPEATEQEVREAAETAQAADFINRFQDTFGTSVEGKGMSLSGGQKQRISIARAVLRQPEILMLDDATSALDLETEYLLRQAVRRRFAGSTVIVVAQRIASIREADRIAVMEEDGRIRHCGTHEELLAESATYRAIWDSQMEPEEAPAAAGEAEQAAAEETAASASGAAAIAAEAKGGARRG